MFSKLALIVTSAFIVAGVAIPTYGGGGGSCNSGTIQCCDSIENSNNLSESTGLLQLVGVNAEDLTGLVGKNCIPVVGGSCNQQTACCTGNSFNGLIVLGCSPINVAL